MKKKIIIVVCVVLVLGGGIWWYRSRDVQEIVPTEKVTRGDVVETVSVSGELLPVTYADLSFPSTGTVDALGVKEGDSVEVGQKIASIDRSVLFSQWKEARVALSIAEENEKLARRSWDDLKPEERQAKRLATEQARENVATLKAQMERSILTAPFSGRISQVSARVGEVATIGSPIVRLVKDDGFLIESRVPESDIAKLAVGMTARVTFDAFSLDEVFEAVITKIDPAATVVQDVVSYVVTLELRQTDNRLREGMTTNIDIETAKRTDVLTVPFRALSKESGRYFAEVKQSDGTFRKTEVSTGLEGDEGVIEIESGLNEGDEVTIGARQKK